MKNVIEILKEIGVEVPEDKHAELNKQISENYKTVAEFGKTKEKLEAERDNYKGQLETAQNALKEFEGIDVKELSGKVATLTNDLATQQATYESRLADMEFSGVLDMAIAGSGARNAKTVKALLDIEMLKQSKNRSEDIKAALEQIKKENDYLFEGAPNITTSVPSGNSGTTKMSLSEAMAYKNAHPEADITSLI